MPKIKAMPRPTGGVVGWIMPEMDGSGRFIEVFSRRKFAFPPPLPRRIRESFDFPGSGGLGRNVARTLGGGRGMAVMMALVIFIGLVGGVAGWWGGAGGEPSGVSHSAGKATGGSRGWSAAIRQTIPYSARVMLGPSFRAVSWIGSRLMDTVLPRLFTATPVPVT